MTYQYDGTGRRTERTQGGTTEHDYYSGQQVIQVYDYNGPVSPANFQGGQQYIWSPLYIDTPILRDTYDSSGDRVPGEQLYYTTDADHNVTAVVQNNTIDGAWEAAERYSYDAYGDVTVYDRSWSPITGNQSQPGIDNTRLFAGMDADPLTGAYYDNARWYDPTNGTFFGRDPIASSANLYEYCGDDPLNRTDPTGKSWLTVYDDGKGHVCGYSIWLLTGSWCADPDVVIAATDAHDKYTTCWWDCEITVHKCVTTYACEAAAAACTTAFTHLEIAKGQVRQGIGSPGNVTTMQSALALWLAQQGYKGIGQQLLRQGAQQVSGSVVSSGIKSGVAGAAIVETTVAWACAWKCSK